MRSHCLPLLSSDQLVSVRPIAHTSVATGSFPNCVGDGTAGWPYRNQAHVTTKIHPYSCEAGGLSTTDTSASKVLEDTYPFLKALASKAGSLEEQKASGFLYRAYRH